MKKSTLNVPEARNLNNPTQAERRFVRLSRVTGVACVPHAGEE